MKSFNDQIYCYSTDLDIYRRDLRSNFGGYRTHSYFEDMYDDFCIDIRSLQSDLLVELLK